MESRKQIAFDLDTKALEENHPSKSWRSAAYEDIRRHMKANGFEWQQGSVYVSSKPISGRNVSTILFKMIDANPWLRQCMRDCRMTSIGKQHDMNYVFGHENLAIENESPGIYQQKRKHRRR